MVGRSSSPPGQGRVTSKLLNKMCQEQDVDKRSQSLTLPSGSRSLVVNFGDREQQKQMSAEDMQFLQNKFHFSDNQLNGVAATVRTMWGRPAVEPKFQQKLVDKAKEMEQFFSVRTCEATVKKNKKVTTVPKPFVYCNDLKGFTDYVLDRRSMDSMRFVALIGIDEGQKSVKVSL